QQRWQAAPGERGATIPTGTRAGHLVQRRVRPVPHGIDVAWSAPRRCRWHGARGTGQRVLPGRLSPAGAWASAVGASAPARIRLTAWADVLRRVAGYSPVLSCGAVNEDAGVSPLQILYVVRSSGAATFSTRAASGIVVPCTSKEASTVKKTTSKMRSALGTPS